MIDSNQVEKDIVETLKKHQIPALLAVDILNKVSRDIVCYFNTKDMGNKYFGEEIIIRKITESDVGGRGGGTRFSWDDVLGNSRQKLL